MKYPNKYLYHHKFIAGLRSKINFEVPRCLESLKMEDVKFTEDLELASRAKLTINAQFHTKK